MGSSGLTDGGYFTVSFLRQFFFSYSVVSNNKALFDCRDLLVLFLFFVKTYHCAPSGVSMTACMHWLRIGMKNPNPHSATVWVPAPCPWNILVFENLYISCSGEKWLGTCLASVVETRVLSSRSCVCGEGNKSEYICTSARVLQMTMYAKHSMWSSFLWY